MNGANGMDGMDGMDGRDDAAGGPATGSVYTGPVPAGTAATAPAPAAPEPDPAAPAPLGVGRTPTGQAGVDSSLDRLADADHLAIDGHLEVYEDVHRGLRDALTALDAQPGPPPPTTAPGGSDRRS